LNSESPKDKHRYFYDLHGGYSMDLNEKKAAILFAEGFNCAQSVITSHAGQFGLESEIALKLSAAFGAGMGRKGEVCGAVTGALMAIGLASGPTSADDKEAKEHTYLLTRRFLDEFARQNGSILCRELLSCQIDEPEGLEKARQQGLFTTICPRLVDTASEILDGMLEDESSLS
jgi:C_GCAxxG_C_C family probable redox protein